jgi:hypothetical protein
MSNALDYELGMRSVSKIIDELPAWAKVVLCALTLIGSGYCIAHYGFWSFILHVIFNPIPA